MSKEPTKEEMLEFIDETKNSWDWTPEENKLFDSIHRLIEGQPPIKKSLMKLAEDLGVSFSAAKIISDHAQPEVDVKFIEKLTAECIDEYYKPQPPLHFRPVVGIKEIILHAFKKAGMQIKED